MAEPTLQDRLNRPLRLPVIAAPMFLISGPDLVIAAGKAGIIGAFPAPNARTISDLAAWLSRISAELAAAGRAGKWAINMIVHQTYERFDAEFDLICQYQPMLVFTALGSPRRALERVHGYGGAVFSDVINPDQARKAIDAGADGLVLVAAGAGGAHRAVHPVRLCGGSPAFLGRTARLGGAIGSARAIVAAQALGADLAYMGTRFIAARESLVSDANREMLIRASMADIVTTSAITGVRSNWMRESLDAAGFTPEMLQQEKKVDFSDLHAERKAWKTIWGAGHSVGNTVQIEGVEDIAADLDRDYRALTDLRSVPVRPVAKIKSPGHDG